MTDDPQYTMWKARYEAEQAALQERAAWHARRDAERAGWRDAWRTYQAHWREGPARTARPPWWNVLAWLRVLRGSGPGSL